MIEIIELVDDSGDISTLLAWGIHEPAVFIAAVSAFGYGPEHYGDVRHERYMQLRRNPHTGRFQRWYEPVMGEPNATVIVTC